MLNAPPLPPTPVLPAVPALRQAVAEGKLYVNVHTKQFIISALDGELQLAGGEAGAAPSPAPGPLPPPKMWTASLDRWAQLAWPELRSRVSAAGMPAPLASPAPSALVICSTLPVPPLAGLSWPAARP